MNLKIKLAVRLGVDLSVLGSGYRSRKTADGLLAAINDNVSTDAYKEISDSEFLSISCDETTDISNTGKLIVYTMAVDADLRVKTYFVGDYNIVDKTADGLTSKLKECFEEAGIDLTKVMALGSDGAATMTGCRNGVGVQLQRLNPFMIQFHCSAHKLALCTSQAAESVSLMQKYKDTLKSIYYYFKGSHCRSDKLKAVQGILDSPQLKVKEIHDVRWFAFYDSLRVVYQCWEALAQSFNAAKDPKAKGLYKAITSYSFLALTYFLMDIIPVVTVLNLKFQRQDLDISVIGPSVRLAIHELDVMTEYSSNLKQLDDNIMLIDGKHFYKGVEVITNENKKFKSASKDFVTKLKENLETRFPSESLSLTTAAEVLALKGISFVSKEKLTEFGNEKLNIVLDHFGTPKTLNDGSVIQPVLNSEEAKREWSLLKQMVRDDPTLVDPKLSTMWQLIAAMHGKEFPNLVKLVKIVLIFPLQTATCERGFSVQNCTKTVTRNRLQESNLGALMNICINGPTQDMYDFKPASKLWKSTKDRKLYTN